MLRLAEASKRVLLIHHTRPIKLQDVLAPNIIDWVPKPDEIPHIMNPKNRVGAVADLGCDGFHYHP